MTVFLNVEDFLQKAERIAPLSPEEEAQLYARLQAGDLAARERLAEGYLPLVAARIRRGPQRVHTLKAVYACIGCVERCVATFDFSRGKREFLHMLSWRLRQCIIRCIAEG
jgi:DNA-directed RNA polymerase specialized sigma subunit